MENNHHQGKRLVAPYPLLQAGTTLTTYEYAMGPWMTGRERYTSVSYEYQKCITAVASVTYMFYCCCS